MTLLVPNQGEADFLSYAVAKSAPQNLFLRLFKSNTTPAESDTAATYTEANFPGYQAIELTAANWTITAGAPSVASYAQQAFTCTGGGASQDVYGYYLTRATSGNIAWAERFTQAPYQVVNNGDQVLITPKLTAD